ncbi:hypothetical protein [Piscirickettsia litoralis]|uniref:Uncharacterized protein n=1 Tax=Piscirickettsia litoralis TaxID=1891921 RepID=A0ABX2ZYQ0_9GAMM|nr:hypothetical protein [Piscirickettsia litoralis]ODN41358.1 hypothetical protein BGC07_16435 [Piscirickettsia litoralis]
MPEILPSKSEVKKYLKIWDEDEKYVNQDKSLKKLFGQIYRKNDKLENVLIKVSALNDFYSTNIYGTHSMAKHIVSLNIDQRLLNHDHTLVDEIASVPYGNKYLYSFATKYCCHHESNQYPIYDSFVDKVLTHLKKKDKFCKFRRRDLKEYPKFIEILKQFKAYYGLEGVSFRELDRYLWLTGKKNFK